jgi:hypothetical protein
MVVYARDLMGLAWLALACLNGPTGMASMPFCVLHVVYFIAQFKFLLLTGTPRPPKHTTRNEAGKCASKPRAHDDS